VIFKEAQVKVFLTASAQERADRRYKQLKNKGLNASLSDILMDIQQRDERDENRSIAPLKPADDALVIDCTQMTITDVEQKILTFIHSKGIL
jgi:cytidylate kinase